MFFKRWIRTEFKSNVSRKSDFLRNKKDTEKKDSQERKMDFQRKKKKKIQKKKLIFSEEQIRREIEVIFLIKNLFSREKNDFMGGHHLRYPLPYPLHGFFLTTLPEPYSKSKSLPVTACWHSTLWIILEPQEKRKLSISFHLPMFCVGLHLLPVLF